MNILPHIKIIGLALKIKDTLIVGDIHIGYEEALAKQGILMPRFHFKDVMRSMESILKKAKPKTIVIIGDLKHEFGAISEQEWRDTLKFLALLEKHCKKIILLKGNHDTILGPIAKKKNLEIVDKYAIDDVLLAHGDKIPRLTENKSINTIIIGHEHPAVSIGTKIRMEKYKCFLAGKYEGKNLIVLPSFNPILEGTDVLKEEILSPFLKKGRIMEFKAYIIDEKNDKIYNFGKLDEIRKKHRH